MSTFSMVRSTTISAPREKVHALIDDFHQWRAWSPWEELDPGMERTYTGPERGVGARYEWSGNRKAGRGSMEITASTPERIDIDLEFIAPFKASNKTTFALEPQAETTSLTWNMSGERGMAMHLLGRLYFDRVIAKDFDRGLARLKATAEG